MREGKLHSVECLRFVFSITIGYFHILHSNIMGCVGEDLRYQGLQSLSDNTGLIVECFFILGGYFLFAFVKNCDSLSLFFSVALGIVTYHLVERPGMKLYSRLSTLIVKKENRSL